MLIKEKIFTIILPWAIATFGMVTMVLGCRKTQIKSNLEELRGKFEWKKFGNANKPSISTTTLVGASVPSNVNDNRLPANLIPRHYNLFLRPDISSGTFSGKVKVEMEVIQATQQIILHSNQLNITKVRVNKALFGINVLHYQLDHGREFLIINLDKVLVAGKMITLSISFTGSMRDKIVGLYSSTYTKPDGTPKNIATSKFEATYARQAFPCFDEPAMKANFTVTVEHPLDGDYHALSNMDIDTRKDWKFKVKKSYSVTRFKESVPMSTYLVGIIVSDLQFRSKTVETNGIGSNFDIRIFATSHQMNKVNFALDIAVRVTQFYIQFFGIEYPLPKLDMAAVPDFDSNAMENWGLLTYRESLLLYDPKMSSAANVQKMATLVGHELSHMWFGNLVTMMWWNDLWLNEGFARYMEFKSIDQIYPGWGMSDQFLVHVLHSVMKYDSLLSSHPIVKSVSSSDQIAEMFDMITYQKGASVIRMLEEFVGYDNFRLSITSYLNKFKYKNAVTDDLFTEIEALGLDFDVKTVMRTWTEQMGLPVVDIQQITSTEYEIRQMRFLSNPEDYDKEFDYSPFNYTWTIPITYITSESQEIQSLWLNYDVPGITIEVPYTVEWIKLNVKQVGYYRVNYPLHNWRSLTEELVQNPQTFSVADRAHLLNDVFALADASQLEYDVALDMTTYLQRELSYVPWSVATTTFLTLQYMLRGTDSYNEYQRYVRELVREAYENVTWTVGSDHVMNLFRVTILKTACSFGLPECLEEASNRLTAWHRNPSEKPSPDLREIVYYYGMKNVGTEELWNDMWNAFKVELDSSEKIKLMHGLAGIQNARILRRFVELAWNENNIRRQDYFKCLQDIAVSSIGESVVWDYVRENWERMVQRFGLNEQHFGRLIPSITGRFSTEIKLNEMINFFEKYPEAGGGTASRKQALEIVKNNIVWLKNNKDTIAEWLRNQ